MKSHPWELSNLAEISWGELAQKTTQQSKERGEKQANQHAETGSRVKLPSHQIKICLTRSLLNNPLVSTPFRNINIQLGKGDFLMGGSGCRSFRRWMIVWTDTMWKRLRHIDFRCHSLKPKATAADPLERVAPRRVETWAPSLPLCRSYIILVRQDWKFSNGANCNTRSRWCRLKPSLSVWILNASQS